MKFKIKNYFFVISFLIYINHTFEQILEDKLRYALNNELLQNKPICFPEDKAPLYYYLNIDTGNIEQCEEHCIKCAYLKSGNISQCIACEDNYFLYNYKCIEKCPNDTYFYNKTIKLSDCEENRKIKVCSEICEEGYTEYIILDNNNENITNKICILNENEEIKNNIEIELNEFIKLNESIKFNRITDKIEYIKTIIINEIAPDEKFKNINKEFKILNEFVNNAEIDFEKYNMSEIFNSISNYYFEQIEKYFSSYEGEKTLLNNTNDVLIYFISALSSLLSNKNLLSENYYSKLINYTLKYNQELQNIPLASSDIGRLNTLTNYYMKYLNDNLDKVVNYIDPNFDKDEFDTNEFYRYNHEILLNEENRKLMNITNNMIKLFLNINSDLFIYKNDYISFYKNKLIKDEKDKQIKIPNFELELYILGWGSTNTTDDFSISNILDSIDEGSIDNYKIIIPPLNTINSQVNWDDAFFNLVIFNEKYPLLNGNNTKYVSPNFFDINFYDKNKNIIKIDNLNKNNYIKIIKKKSQSERLLHTCVYYDPIQNNLFDKGIKSYDLVQYVLCSTSHLSTFTLASFSPSLLLSKAENNKAVSEDEKIKNSRWIKDANMLNKLTSDKAIIIYINLGILFFCLILLIIKFLITTEPTKAEQIIEDSYIRYTINEDIESDKKILKYLIEKEIEFILKTQSDYEKQKRQEQALNSKNDVFNAEQQVITIIEDGSDDDDEEDIYIDKRIKKVSFRDASSEKKNRNSLNSNLKRKKTLRKTQHKKKEVNKDNNIELSNNINNENNNDFIELDENKDEEINNSQSKKYKYFNFKNNTRKANIASSVASSNRRSTFANFENLINEKKAQSKKSVKKQSLNERFKKGVKEQKSRLIYSIMDKTISEFKSNGQNTLDIPTNMIKRPLSMIGISNALNKISNKDDEKILIKNEFLVILKLILFILYQYEYRFICLFNKIILPITSNNLIVLMGFRLSIQLTLSSVFSPRYFGDNYDFAKNVLAMFLTLISCDVIYTILEIILMKKKISTSTENKDKTIIKFKQIIESIIGYIIMLFIFLFGLYNSILISLYLDEEKINCKYIVNFIAVFFIDYLIYENIIIIIKGFILTYAVYQDIEGCGLRIMDFFNKIFIFYLAE